MLPSDSLLCADWLLSWEQECTSVYHKSLSLYLYIMFGGTGRNVIFFFSSSLVAYSLSSTFLHVVSFQTNQSSLVCQCIDFLTVSIVIYIFILET